MLGNLGEQAVLDGIPLGGAGRVVSNGDGKAEGITYLPLEFNLQAQEVQLLLPPESTRTKSLGVRP
jgi:hypothetical protein